MNQLVVTDLDGGGRRVVDATNWAMWTSSDRPGAKVGTLYLPWDAIQKQPKVDGSSVPLSVRRPSCAEDDTYTQQQCRPGRPLPPIPIPEYDRINGHHLSLPPGRLDFRCTYGRPLPPIPESDRPRSGRKTPIQMPTIPETGRFKYPGRPFFPSPPDVDTHTIGRPLPPVPSGPGYNLWHSTLPGAANDTSDNIDLTYEDRRIDALKRAKKIKDIKSKKGEDIIAMNKKAALRRVEKLKKKKRELAQQNNLSEHELSCIYDVINEKIRNMFVVTLNDIRRDIVEVKKMLQYKIGERDAYIDKLEYERGLLTIQKTGVVLNIYRDNANMENIERLMRLANEPGHSYFQKDWNKIMERQKHRTDIFNLIKLKKKTLKNLCTDGNIRFNDDIQVMVNLIHKLNENSKSIKILRGIFIQQCIDNDLEWQIEIEKEMQELAEEPQEVDPETLARIKRVVSRTAEDIRLEEQEQERKEKEIYDEKVRNMKEILDRTKQDFFTHLSIRRELGEGRDNEDKPIQTLEINYIDPFDKTKRKYIKKDRKKWEKLDKQYTKHARSHEKKWLSKLKRQQRLQALADILSLKRFENCMLIRSYQRARRNVANLTETQRNRMRRMKYSVSVKLRNVKRTFTSLKQRGMRSRPIIRLRKTCQQMKIQIRSTRLRITKVVKENVTKAANRVSTVSRDAGSKVSKVASVAGKKLSKGLVLVGSKTDKALNKVYWQYTRFMKPKPIRTKHRFYVSRTITHKRVIGDNPIARFFDALLTSLYFRNATVIKLRKNAVVPPKIKDIDYEDSPSYAAFSYINKEETARRRWKLTKAESSMTLEQYLGGIKKPDIPLLDSEVKRGSEIFLQYENKLGRKLNTKERIDLEERLFELRTESIQRDLFGHIQNRTLLDFTKFLKNIHKYSSTISIDLFTPHVEHLLSEDFLSSDDSFICKHFHESIKKVANKKSKDRIIAERNRQLNKIKKYKILKQMAKERLKRQLRKDDQRNTLRRPVKIEQPVYNESDSSTELIAPRRQKRHRRKKKGDTNVSTVQQKIAEQDSKIKEINSFSLRKPFRKTHKVGYKKVKDSRKCVKDKTKKLLSTKTGKLVNETKRRSKRKRVIGTKAKKSPQRKFDRSLLYKRSSSSGSPGYSSHSSENIGIYYKKKGQNSRSKQKIKSKPRKIKKEKKKLKTSLSSMISRILKPNKMSRVEPATSLEKEHEYVEGHTERSKPLKKNSKPHVSLSQRYRQMREKQKQKKAKLSEKLVEEKTDKKIGVSSKKFKDGHVRKPSLWNRAFTDRKKVLKQKKTEHMSKLMRDPGSSQTNSSEASQKERKRKKSMLSSISSSLFGPKASKKNTDTKNKVTKSNTETSDKSREKRNMKGSLRKSLSKNLNIKRWTKRKTYLARKQGINKRKSGPLSWKELHKFRYTKQKDKAKSLQNIRPKSSSNSKELKRKSSLRKNSATKRSLMNIFPKGVFGRKVKKTVSFDEKLIKMPANVSSTSLSGNNLQRASSKPVKKVFRHRRKRRSNIKPQYPLGYTSSSESDLNRRVKQSRKIQRTTKGRKTPRKSNRQTKKTGVSNITTEKGSFLKRFMRNSFKRNTKSKVNDDETTASPNTVSSCAPLSVSSEIEVSSSDIKSSDSSHHSLENKRESRKSSRQSVKDKRDPSSKIERRPSNIGRALSTSLTRLRNKIKRNRRTSVQEIDSTSSSASIVPTVVSKSPSNQALRGSITSLDEPKGLRSKISKSFQRLRKKNQKRKEGKQSSTSSVARSMKNALRDSYKILRAKNTDKPAKSQENSSAMNKKEHEGLKRRFRDSFGNLLKKKNRRKRIKQEKISLHDFPKPSLKKRMRDSIHRLRKWRNPDATSSSPSISSYELPRPRLQPFFKPKNSWIDYSSSDSTTKQNLRTRLRHSYRRWRMKRNLRKHPIVVTRVIDNSSSSVTKRPSRLRSIFSKKKKSSSSLNRNWSSRNDETNTENNHNNDTLKTPCKQNTIRARFASFFKKFGKARKDNDVHDNDDESDVYQSTSSEDDDTSDVGSTSSEDTSDIQSITSEDF